MALPTIDTIVSPARIVHRAVYNRGGYILYGCSSANVLPRGTPTETILVEEQPPLPLMPTKGVQLTLKERGLRLCKLCFRGPKHA